MLAAPRQLMPTIPRGCHGAALPGGPVGRIDRDKGSPVRVVVVQCQGMTSAPVTIPIDLLA